ncbi:hypothetical protein JCM5296_000484, partial [Sporobolomyces johnsonii]
NPPSAKDIAAEWEFIQKIWDDVVLKADDAPLEAPPYREVMHEIPFTVEHREDANRITYKFPDSFLAAFDEICDAHVKAKIWIPCSSEYADPMMPLTKSDGRTLRPVVDLRRRNAITRKKQMPVVDQERIVNLVAGARYVTIGDIQGAFQQLRVRDEDLHKTVFSTPRGLFRSVAAQQGDCNSTVTLDLQMQHMLGDLRGKGVEWYADDLFLMSETWAHHVALVRTVLSRLQKAKFYLRKTKFRHCTNERDVLGREVRPNEIRVARDKVDEIASLTAPKTKRQLQRILGMLEFNAKHIPHYGDVAAPLTALTGNAPWRWTTTCQLALDELKRLIMQRIRLTCIKQSELALPDTRPIHLDNPAKNEPVTNPSDGKYLFLFTDASVTGAGSALAIGTNWWLSDLVGLHSRKFSPAEMNYPTHEQELQATYEAFQHFESKLLGRKVFVLVDNKALSHFFTSKRLIGRQARIWTYLSQFDFELQHLAGTRNVTADWLSRQWEDEREAQVMLGAMSLQRERRRPRRYDDDILEEDEEPAAATAAATRVRKTRHDKPSAAETARQQREATAKNDRAERRRLRAVQDRALEEWNRPVTSELMLDADYDRALAAAISAGYRRDTTLKKVWFNPHAFDNFAMRNNGPGNTSLIYMRSDTNDWVLCIPRNGFIRERRVIEVLLEHAHELLGHPSTKATLAYLRGHFWWSTMAKDVADYVQSCPSCQASKPSTTAPRGFLHAQAPPDRPFDAIGLDFQGPFPMSRWGDEEVDYLFNAIDLFSGEVILIPTRERDLTARKCAQLYFRLIYPHWGLPKKITSDQDVRWRNEFWQSLFAAVGTTLATGTAYHPQSNGKIERMHRDLNAILTQWVDDTQHDWASYIGLPQHAINSRKSRATGFSPFELTRASPPTSFPGWLGQRATGSAQDELERLDLRNEQARDAVRRSRIDMAAGANAHRRAEDVPRNAAGTHVWTCKGPTAGGDKYWIAAAQLHPMPSRAKKLLPSFVGPFTCSAYDPATSTYTLDLPEHVDSPEDLFPHRVTNTVPVFPLEDVGQTPQASTSATEASTATAESVYANFTNDTPTLTLDPDVRDNAFRTTNPHVVKTDGVLRWKAFRDNKQTIYYKIDPDGVTHLPDEPDLNVHEIPPDARRRGAPAQEVASDEEMEDATPRAATMQMIRDAHAAEQRAREAKDRDDALHAQQAAALIAQQQADASQYRAAAQAAQQTALAQAAAEQAQAAHVPAAVLQPFAALPPLAPATAHYAQRAAAEMRQQEAIAQADTLRAQAAAAPPAYRQHLPPPPPAPLAHAAPVEDVAPETTNTRIPRFRIEPSPGALRPLGPHESEIQIEGDWYHPDTIPAWFGVDPVNQENVDQYIHDTDYHAVTGHRREGQHLRLFVLGPDRDAEGRFPRETINVDCVEYCPGYITWLNSRTAVRRWLRQNSVTSVLDLQGNSRSKRGGGGGQPRRHGRRRSASPARSSQHPSAGDQWLAAHQGDMFDMLLQAGRTLMANAASTSRAPSRRYEDDSDDDQRSYRSRRYDSRDRYDDRDDDARSHTSRRR